jgi:glycosyltransferase involved in cell wall biosynthesis
MSAKLVRAVRQIWRLLPEGWRAAFWKSSGTGVRNLSERMVVGRPATECPDPEASRIVIAGLFSTASGLGEAARSTYRALCAAGFDPVAVDLSGMLAVADMESGIPCQDMPADDAGILILQVNAPETGTALQALNIPDVRQWYIVGYWAWELPGFPEGWDHAFAFVSEIWTVSRFSAAALRSHPDAPPIHVFGHAISPPRISCAGKAGFDLPEDAFVFLVMADSLSSMERKNPFAAIAAFKQAFGDAPDKLLLVKTRNLAARPEAEADIRDAIGSEPNIRIMDESLSEEARWCLIQSVDAVVSLHRSEGFGLVLAEAMALGQPVITTNWSGPEDFTDRESAFLVDFTMVPCEDKYGVYGDSGSQWTEPDVAQAARIMQQVAADPDLCRSVGTQARLKIADRLGAAKIGAGMRRRLEEASR